MDRRFRRLAGYVAIALALVMLGAALPLAQQPDARAEAVQAENVQTVIVTSPFTQAVAQVRDSVVGVSNYQVRRYSSYNYPDWSDFGFGYGFDFDFGFGFGNGYGNRNSQEDQTREVEAATGSGVVVGQDYVLTNYHVVEGASSLKVTVAGQDPDTPDVYEAQLVAYDENLDVAVIHVPDLPLTPVRLGDSDTLQVGDWAICIGNPLGKKFSGTVTAGIVSGLNRNISSTNTDRYGRRETITNTMIQVDAAINSGNSGGGMFSVTGELMGIPTLKYSGSLYSSASVEGIGMCIPINAAKPLINAVLSGEIIPQQTAADTAQEPDINESLSVEDKPRMGVALQSINTSSYAVRSGAIPNGAYVQEVEAGSPAEEAGMLPGDIIVDVENTVITSVRQLQQVVSRYQVGDTLRVKVYRVPGITGLHSNDEIPAGEYIDMDVTLAVISETVHQ